jgi:hypothetical protein
MRFSWKPVTFALLVATAVVYAPVFTGRVPFPTYYIYEFPAFAPGAPPYQSPMADIGDLVTQFYPYRTLTARAIRSGEFPMWNPYMTSGTVFLGNPLSALFYPPHALYYFLPVAVAWNLGFVLRTFLLGFFTALFLQRIGATATGAIVAALLVTFSGFITAWQGQPIPDAALWLPLICYSIVRLHADRSRRSIVIAAFAFAMPALAGHPETSAHLTFTGTALALFLSMFRPVPGLPRRSLQFACQFLLGFGAAGILSLALASIQLIPTLEWFANAYRGLDIVWPPAPTWSMLGLVSRDTLGTTNSFGLQIPVQATYIGMLAFIAAPVGLLSHSKKFVLFFTVLTGAALCVAYGIGPLFELSHHVPFYKTLKNDRLMLMVIFGASVLAGLGVTVIEQRREPLRAALLAVPGFFTASAMIYLVYLLTNTAPRPLQSAAASFVFLLIGAAIVAWKLAGGLNDFWFKTAICLVVACDVCTFAYGYIPFEKRRTIFPPNPLFQRLQTMEQGPFRVTQLAFALPANVELMYGLYESGGYEIPLARIKKFSQGMDQDATDSVFFESPKVLESNDRRPDLLNTKYYLVSLYDPNYRKFRERKDSFQWRFEYGDTAIFENLRALPAAFLVPSNGVKIIPDDERQLAMIKDASFDPEQSVIVAQTLKTVGAKQNQPAGSLVRWVARRNNSFQLKVDAENDSVLVVSQTYYPGWRAWVDGQEAQIVPADYALTGIAVTAGSHDVTFAYQPISFRIGLAISAAALLAIVLLLL